MLQPVILGWDGLFNDQILTNIISLSKNLKKCQFVEKPFKISKKIRKSKEKKWDLHQRHELLGTLSQHMGGDRSLHFSNLIAMSYFYSIGINRDELATNWGCTSQLKIGIPPKILGELPLFHCPKRQKYYSWELQSLRADGLSNPLHIRMICLRCGACKGEICAIEDGKKVTGRVTDSTLFRLTRDSIDHEFSRATSSSSVSTKWRIYSYRSYFLNLS